MSTYSFYDLSTGLFVGRSYTGPLDALAVNTPAGCGAMKGAIDYQAFRVDLKSGDVLPYQPPPPPLEDQKADAAIAVVATIDSIESAQDRAVRELVLALAAASKLPAAVIQPLADIDAEIAAQRDQLAAIADATTEDDLKKATDPDKPKGGKP